MGDRLLGISGLTPGGLGVWALVALSVLGIVAYWVKGMAERKRASNEGTTAESKASQAQFERLEKEIERLTDRVSTLERASDVKDVTIAELTAMKLEVLAERAADRVVNTAKIAERDAEIANLRSQLLQFMPVQTAAAVEINNAVVTPTAPRTRRGTK